MITQVYKKIKVVCIWGLSTLFLCIFDAEFESILFSFVPARQDFEINPKICQKNYFFEQIMKKIGQTFCMLLIQDVSIKPTLKSLT